MVDGYNFVYDHTQNYNNMTESDKFAKALIELWLNFMPANISFNKFMCDIDNVSKYNIKPTYDTYEQPIGKRILQICKSDKESVQSAGLIERNIYVQIKEALENEWIKSHISGDAVSYLFLAQWYITLQEGHEETGYNNTSQKISKKGFGELDAFKVFLVIYFTGGVFSHYVKYSKYVEKYGYVSTVSYLPRVELLKRFCNIFSLEYKTMVSFLEQKHHIISCPFYNLVKDELSKSYITVDINVWNEFVEDIKE